MSASAPEATTDYSTGPGPSRAASERPAALLRGLVGLALLAAFLLAISTFLTLLEVTTGEATLDSRSAYEHHSIAMLLLGAAAVPMALGALRGARPAMAAMGVIGLVALVLAFTVDLPAALDEGLYGERYEGASARPGIAFYVETLAGAMLVAIGGVLLLGAGEVVTSRSRGRSGGRDAEPPDRASERAARRSRRRPDGRSSSGE